MSFLAHSKLHTMIPRLNFLIPIFNLFVILVENIDNKDFSDDGNIVDVVLLRNIMTILNVFTVFVLNLDLISQSDQRANDIHKLIHFCDNYRWVFNTVI